MKMDHLRDQIDRLTKKYLEQEKTIKQLTDKLASLEARIKVYFKPIRSETNHGFILDGESIIGNESSQANFISAKEKYIKAYISDSQVQNKEESNRIFFEKVHPVEASQDTNVDMEEEISNEKQKYAEGLTIHGMSRIATGGPLSRIVWTILVITSLAAAVLISKEHWDSYLSNGSITKLKMVTEQELKYPSITICNYLGVLRERRLFSGGSPEYTHPVLVNISDMRDCGRNLTKCGYKDAMFLKVQHYTADYRNPKPYNNLVKFDNTTNCFTLSGFIQKVPSDFFSVQAVANRTANLWTELYVNPGPEIFQEASSTVYWASEGWYHVALTKKIITRLGLPYTDCIEGSGTYAQNKFTGNYTITKCKKSCFFEEVFKRCGAIPQMYKRHMREPNRFNNKTFVSDVNGQACLKQVENDASLTTECNALCYLHPCYEEDIKMSLDYHKALTYPNFLEFAFTFQSFLIEVIEEVPAYTWQDLFANFGGCVGLMTGASILSLVELFIFFGLIIFDLFDIYSKICALFSPKQK